MRGDDVLTSPKAGALVIRGSLLRAGGYLAGAALGAAVSVFLLRGLGVEDFGRYATVAALLAIVSTISDAGLTAVGTSEMALRERGRERDDLLADLITLRIALTLAGVAAAAVFAVVVGYDDVLVAGVLLGGLGVLLVNTQATTMAPLAVDLRVGTITAVELLKSAVTLAAVAALALAGASLLPYFAVQAVVGLVVLALAPRLLGSAARLRPRLRRAEALTLLRTAAPVGLALAMNVLYLRLLVVMVSLETPAVETGLYGTAFRVVELFITIPPLVIGVALPLLAVAGTADLPRLRYSLQRLTEGSVAAAIGLALVVTVLAEPTLRLLGGEEYVGAGSMLRIQVWALVPLAAGSVLSFALLALRRRRDLAVANAAAVAVVLVAGFLLVRTHGGEGAAVAGVVAESALLLALLAFLTRRERSVVPRFAFLWRPLAALAAGLATLVLPLPEWVDGAAAGAAFLVVAVLVRALPPEVVEAVRRRAPGDRA